MKVGLNCIFMTEAAGGIGSYVRELIPALLTSGEPLELTVFASREAPLDFTAAEWAGEVKWAVYPKGPASRWNTIEVLAAVPAAALRRRLDLVHSPAGIGPQHVPGPARVVTLMDLIWHHEAERVALPRRARFVTQTLAFGSARDADRVIAPSHATADDIAATVGVDAAKVDVVELGVPKLGAGQATPAAELRERLGLGDRRVLLSIAQRRPYKNLDSLVRALPDLPADIVLVLGGAPGPADDELRALAGRLAVGERLVICEWLPAADIEGLYEIAEVVALPSFMEGFGLPVLEAMQRGVPVACSASSSLGEIAGDAALTFDPRDQAAITTALDNLFADPALRASLVERGRARAATFTWERTASGTFASYERALGA
jgi:glycosyltransferase involved in cell wall biosynthesis